MPSASYLAGSAAGLIACLACIAFMVLLVQGGFTQNAGIAMGVCCLCGCISGVLNPPTTSSTDSKTKKGD
jgi:hypothetical protein